MKRFFVSVMCASVFFLGLGGLFDITSARFKSDEKALELISRARTAIGGDSAIGDVQSMTIVGATTNFFEKDGVPTTELGGVEINFQMPGLYSKSVKIGEPGADAAFVDKKVDVVVVTKEGDKSEAVAAGPAGDKNVFVIRKGEGDVQWKTDENSDLKVEGNRMILKKDDGTVVELPKDGVHKVIVSEEANSGDAVWNTDDGKRIVIEKTGSEFAPRAPHSGGNEMLRMTMALLMTAPEGSDVSYKFVGEGDVDGYPANIIAVESNGGSFKLFLDASTSLPRMITYTGHSAVFFRKSDTDPMSKDQLIKLTESAAAPAEHQIRFSDYRSVGGLLLPYRWSESVNGKQTLITDVSTYEVNPANIADKFGKQKIFVRRVSPDKN